MFIRRKNIFTFLLVLLCVCISLPIILPYFHAGYFPTHDGEWAVVRLGEMFREIKDHQFPPRYSGNLNFGYGYPLFNFTYPFPYYLGLFFRLGGIPFITSIKLLFALTVPVSVIGMYFAAKAFWKDTWAAFVAAVLYAYVPYRLVDLYVRGSIGESLGFLLFPFLFLFTLKLFESQRKRVYLVLIAVCFAMLVISHNIMATFFAPLLVIFAVTLFLYNRKNIQSLVCFIFACLGGGMLSAFFWLPALSEKHLILLAKIPIADRSLYFVKPLQLISNSWGYGIPTAAGGFSYQIGLPHLILMLLAFAYFLLLLARKQLAKKLYFQTIIFLVLSMIGMVTLLFSFTAFIWQHTPLLSEINYPWTLLAPLGFIICFFSGLFCIQKQIIIKYLVPTIIMVAAIGMFLPHAKPQYYTYNSNNYYLTNDATTTSSSELMPLWVTQMPLLRSNDKVEVLSGKGQITTLTTSSKMTSFTANLLQPSVIRINTIYYPGWIVRVDGHTSSVNYRNPHGVMDITVPSGVHPITAQFTETPLRLFADIVSCLGVLCLLILLLPKIPFIKK